jgi:hypothetical protein
MNMTVHLFFAQDRAGLVLRLLWNTWSRALVTITALKTLAKIPMERVTANPLIGPLPK